MGSLKYLHLIITKVFLALPCNISTEEEEEEAQVFIRLDGQGQELPDDLQQWSMVKDIRSGLIWRSKRMLTPSTIRIISTLEKNPKANSSNYSTQKNSAILATGVFRKKNSIPLWTRTEKIRT